MTQNNSNVHERIKQLVEQALQPPHRPNNGYIFPVEKFAELLIQDVAKTMGMGEQDRQYLYGKFGLEFKPTMLKQPSYGDLMASEEWNDYVESGGFNSDDGSGYWATATEYALISCWEPKPDWATHVLWFNK